VLFFSENKFHVANFRKKKIRNGRLHSENLSIGPNIWDLDQLSTSSREYTRAIKKGKNKILRSGFI
jgi:hypothetical protein